jgi:hypothetical protein
MSPEALDQTLDTKSFESFKMADMYSFGKYLTQLIFRKKKNQKMQLKTIF